MASSLQTETIQAIQYDRGRMEPCSANKIVLRTWELIVSRRLGLRSSLGWTVCGSRLTPLQKSIDFKSINGAVDSFRIVELLARLACVNKPACKVLSVCTPQF